MNILYIGIYENGSTSKMRGEIIKSLFPDATYNVIDTSIPFDANIRLLKSLAFRFKIGPVINKINRYVISKVNNLNIEHYDLIWIDKGIFITKETTQILKNKSSQLVHYTPDPAFTFHKSRHFRSSLALYDFAITTKEYELSYFEKYLNKENVIYVTQGFDKHLHRPITRFKDKKEGILFIGHHEKEREANILKLMKAKIPVTIAGIKWERFASKNKNNKYLTYLGRGIYGEDYVKHLSAYEFAWGAISKWIPELHTTRTFEIPACGTALITERNKETESFFKEEEAIFYESVDEMIDKITYYQKYASSLENITVKGMERVHTDGRDYESIINNIFEKLDLSLKNF
jgi:spore maturation protein CgeB